MVPIDEVIRTCAIGAVAEAAVASVGGSFAADVGRAANARGMSVGDYAVSRVSRFARAGLEGEMRAVASAMKRSERPILAGLERILTFDAPAPPTGGGSGRSLAT